MITPRVAVVGGGAAGLMAAELLSEHGLAVTVYEAMPTVGRKFLLAGRGGLNLTHSELFEHFLARYDDASRARLQPMLAAFSAAAIRGWAASLGIETFVGSSGRVFPKGMKASPLLRAWLRRLEGRQVAFALRHRCRGWAARADGRQMLRFEHAGREREVEADAVLFALGGGSWSRMGTDGRWVQWFEERKVAVAPLVPSNCGFDIHGGWSDALLCHAGAPLKNIVASVADEDGGGFREVAGEARITRNGVEGGAVYALSSRLRQQILAHGAAVLSVDLMPARSAAEIAEALSRPRGRRSLASWLDSRLGLQGVKRALLFEGVGAALDRRPDALVARIKALPLCLSRPRPIDEAISTAGGVQFEALDAALMLRDYPGVFCAGEMLDWDAPTGGYLLSACLASGRHAARGVIDWLARRDAVRG